MTHNFSELLRKAKESLQKSKTLHKQGRDLGDSVSRMSLPVQAVHGDASNSDMACVVGTDVNISEINRLLPQHRAKEAAPRNVLNSINEVLGKLANVTRSLDGQISDTDKKATRYLKDARQAKAEVEVLAGNVTTANMNLNSLIEDLKEPNRVIRETEAKGITCMCGDL